MGSSSVSILRDCTNGSASKLEILAKKSQISEIKSISITTIRVIEASTVSGVMISTVSEVANSVAIWCQIDLFSFIEIYLFCSYLNKNKIYKF